MGRLFLRTWGLVSCCKAGFDIKHLSFPAALVQPQRSQTGGGGPQGQGPLSLPDASTMAGWAQDQTRARVLLGLQVGLGCQSLAGWLLMGQGWLIPECPGAGIGNPEKRFHPHPVLGGPPSLPISFLSVFFALSLVISVIF